LQRGLQEIDTKVFRGFRVHQIGQIFAYFCDSLLWAALYILHMNSGDEACLSTTLCIPRWDSISRPIVQVPLVAGGNDTPRPRPTTNGAFMQGAEQQNKLCYIRRLFTLGSVLKLQKCLCYSFSGDQLFVHFDKKSVWLLLGDFFKNSSGEPDPHLRTVIFRAIDCSIFFC
jgi:hypothetical protein